MINDMKFIPLRNMYYRYIKCNKYPLYKKGKLDKELLKYKDLHKGEACFVIGNGPSLTIGDLDKIKAKGIPSFAANGIYNLFSKTEWRPKYMAFQDYQMIDGLVSLFGDLSTTSDAIFVRRDVYNQVDKKIRDSGKIVYPRLVMNIRKDKYYNFSENLTKYAYDGCTVTYLMIQLAYFMGFSTIYLIGLDHNFPISFDEKGNVIKNDRVEMHAFKDASHVVLNPARVLETTFAYRSARKFLDKKGIKIYNCTRGGKLEEFIRMDLDKVLGD